MAEWDPVQVGDQTPPEQKPAETPANPWAVHSVGGWEATQVNGKPTGPRKGFWSDFGQGTGGVVGLVTAPFTESIPAEAVKFVARNPREFAEETLREGGPIAGFAGMLSKRVVAFMESPDSKDLPAKARQAFKETVALAKERPGLVAGSLVKGLAADPELFFLPEGAGVRAGAAAKTALETAGAGAGAARVGEAVTARAAKSAAGASLGAATEATRELGEGEPLDVGQIGLSGGLGAAFGLVHPSKAKLKLREMTPEEIDRVISPAMDKQPDGPTPHTEIVPTAEGYTVRMKGETEGKSYLTKAEAEHAARELQANASGYRVMGVQPPGTGGRAGMHAFIHENPFTPEKMRDMVKVPEEDARTLGRRLIDFWKKAAVPAAIGAGVGAWLDRDDRETGALFGAAVTLVPRVLPKDKRISIEEVINRRNGLLAVMARHTLQFKSAIDAMVPEAERRMAISLAMEGMPGITLNAAEQRVAGMVREFYTAMGRTAVDAGVLKELLTNYVTHIVEADPAAAGGKGIGDLVARIAQILTGKEDRPTGASGRQFTQQRRYATFGELMQALRGSGLRIKTGDIGEIMAIYSSAMFKTITDKRMIDALKRVPVEGMPPLVLSNQARAQRASTAARLERQPIEGEATQAPEALPPPSSESRELATTDQPIAGAAGGAGVPGAPAEGTGFALPPDPGPGESARRFGQRERMLVQPVDQSDANYVQMPARMLAGFSVHKDIAAQLNFVFNARDPNDATLALMALNQASKRAIVSFSLFHSKSLFDAFVGAMGGRAVLRPFEAAKKAVEMFKYGGSNEGIDDLLKHGLQIQPPEDVKPTQAQAALTKIAEAVDKVLPVTPIKEGTAAIAKFNNALDHFTFGTLQTGFKIITGLDALERLQKKGVPRDAAARMAASYANDIFGSLDWFRVANDVGSRLGRDVVYSFFNPNGRRMMQLLIFAPDWTISTFRAAYKALPGAVDDAALASLHRRYLLKSALYYLTIANGINLITAGHSVFSNENPTRIQLADGRTMQFSKHFMEPFEWLKDPAQTMLNKLAFLPREMFQQLTGKEYLSAHDAAPDIDNRATHLADQFLPIPAQQGLMGGGASSALGLVGMPIYGKTPDEKAEARLKKKLHDLEKRKKAADYYRRQHQ